MKRSILNGTIKRHPDGFGFFIPEDRAHPDVYIPRQGMKGAMSNDRVRVMVYPEGGGGDRFRGEIDQIVARSLQKTIARFTAAAFGAGLIVDTEHSWGSNIVIPEGKTKNAKDGELVCVRILEYGSASTDLKGEVIEVVGDEADPMLDIRRVVYNQNLPLEFPVDVLKEAKAIPKSVDERDFRGRKDLRELDLVTIDGATAKDFDDAVYVENNKEGFRVWVAIADVSHYVQPGTAIDREGYERGNSTYFPNYVIPMLPEELSNELCSLKPHVPRLAFVAEMQLNFTGDLVQSEFYEAVIQSKARVIYGEAQEIIDGNTPEPLKHVESAIRRAGDLAKILMARRFRNGSLDLEIPDSQIILDDGGNPIDIIRADRLFAHRVIEELMLLANIAVAECGTKTGHPFFYRIHEEPALENLEMLNRFLIAFGGTKTIEGDGIQKKITRALQQFEGKPQAEVLSMLTLRAMKQAKYASANVGHFGLGFEDYTHFTSPIRRYSDLIIHRVMKILLKVTPDTPPLTEGTLASAGTHLSACEQRSAKSERQFKSIKRARFMAGFLGQEFDGLISSVTKFGVFVVLRTFDVDGLIRLDDLGKEPFEFDDQNLILTGKRTRTMFSLGDPLKVQVAATNPEEGQVTFTLVEKLAPTFVSPGAMVKTTPPPASEQKAREPRGREPRPREPRTHEPVTQKKFEPRVSDRKEEQKSNRKSGRNQEHKHGRKQARTPTFAHPREPERGAGREPIRGPVRELEKKTVLAEPARKKAAPPIPGTRNFERTRKSVTKEELKAQASGRGRAASKQRQAELQTKPVETVSKKKGASRGTSDNGTPDRSNPKKRGQAEDNRERFRQSRVSKRRGKG